MSDIADRTDTSDHDPLGVVDEDTCRICRGEGTEEDPLFYPCKCRGSIKYIHQGCLEEWLKRSARDASCDICHEKYRFTTVYQEGTPDRAPLHLILLNLRLHAIKSVKYILIIFGLVVGVVIQVPLFYGIIKRFLTWYVDGHTLHEDFYHNLIYGDLTFEGDAYGIENLANAVFQTYTSSLTALGSTIAIITCLFVEHEWVSRDAGFEKLINKAIGPHLNAVGFGRPRVGGAVNNANVADAERRPQNILRNANLNLNGRADEPNWLNIVEDRRILIDALAELANREEQRRLADRLNQPLDEEALGDDDHALSDGGSESESVSESDSQAEAETEEEEEAAELERFLGFNDNERRARVDAEERIDRLNQEHMRAVQHQQRRNLNEVPDIPNIPVDNRIDAAEPEREHVRQNAPLNLNQVPLNLIPGGNINPVRGPADLANQLPDERNWNNADPDDFFAALPVHLIIAVADILIGFYLTIAYFIPSLIGHFLFQIGWFSLEVLSTLSIRIIETFKLSPFINQISNFVLLLRRLKPEVEALLRKHIFAPLYVSFNKIHKRNGPFTSFERSIPICISYGLTYLGILMFLKFKTSQHGARNPLKGFQRKVFVILFDLVCTLKIFLIFAIELIAFPAVCGLMLEFSVTPFVHSEWKFFFSNFQILEGHNILRFLLSWSIGTIYMFLFALYVGMVRRYILRPGVLFFIRSPENQNARLMHDALVRPLKLQLSRIALSGIVYTMYILIGFGLISYGLRLSGSPLLPIYFGNGGFLLFSLLAFRKIYKELPLIKKYVRKYWSRAFKISSSKSRLSSFILGHHNPRERGYVKYRSLLAMLRGSKPDYSDPKTESDAKKLFKTSNAQAFFIPDGNLVRAPNNDIVSRKFARSLFIPVTKDNIPLKSQAELDKIMSRTELDEFDDSEDELTTTNGFEIVYRPPHFGARVIGFIIMLWVFAIILIVGVAVVSNIIGRVASVLFEYLLDKGSISTDLLRFYNDGFTNSSLRIEATSVFAGMSILISGLKAFDKSFTKNHRNQHDGNAHEDRQDTDGEEEEEELDEPRQNLGRRVIDFLGDQIIKIGSAVLLFVSIAYVFTWCFLIQMNAIDIPYKYIRGIENNETDHVILTLHLLASFFTVNEAFKLTKRCITEVLRQDDLTQVALNTFYSALDKFAKTHLVVILLQLSFGTYEYFQKPELYTSFQAALYFVIVKEGAYKNLLVFVWPVVIFSMLGYHGVLKAYELLRKVNAEVKEQYYSKGKTLENTHLEEDL